MKAKKSGSTAIPRLFPPALPRNPQRAILRASFAVVLALSLHALDAEPVSLRQRLTGSWYQVERSNWSYYLNGKYKGLTHRETRAVLSSKPGKAGGRQFSGFFYVLEETLRDMVKASQGVDSIEETVFELSPDGALSMIRDSGYPRLRNFPVMPADPVSPGDSWQSPGIRIIDPRNDGKTTALPILAEYVYLGPEEYQGERVHRIRAKYATRLNKYERKKKDDPNLTGATGTHDVEILVSGNTGAAVLMLDRLDETFVYADGSTIRFKGSTAFFGETPLPVNRAELYAKADSLGAKRQEAGPPEPIRPARESTDHAVQPDTAASTPNTPAPKSTTPAPVPTVPAPGPVIQPDPLDSGMKASPDENPPPVEPFTVEDTDRGVRLSVRDIRFIADSDAIIPNEGWRLDAIAETLSLVPEGKFLIEGHTADVGNPAGEKSLSVQRARKVADELCKRGLKSEQFIYTGYGGTRPIGDNATAQGRALNRRVEITILE